MKNDPTNPKIFRFYGNDEIPPAYYAAMKYYNKLVNNMAALETWSGNPNKFLYATEFNEVWNGNTIYFNGIVAAPYIKYGYYDGNNQATAVKYLNYKAGYKGTRDIPWYHNFSMLTFDDTLSSHYETYLIRRPVGYNGEYTYWHFNRPQEDYPQVFDRGWINGGNDEQNAEPIYGGSVQFNIEKILYHGFFDNSFMLFSNKPWWANLWVVSERWYQDEGMNYSFSTNQNQRPKTGEEIRLMTSLPLQLGCKGILYWQKRTEGDFLLPEPARSKSDGCVGLQPNPDLHFNINDNSYEYIYGNLRGEDLIYSDYKMDFDLGHFVGLGGDYINTTTHDPNGFDRFFDATQYAFNNVNDRDAGMGISQNQIYIGLKSTRAEMYKMHKWIKANESTLMNLRLQSWYAKGFTKWYIQNPKISTSNFLKQFVNVNYVKTRPIDRVNQYNQPYYEQHFGLDSGFYDVTLLKDASENAPANVVYLGVQNRRTDPLILNSTNQLEFITTAEFDNYVRFGGKGFNSSYWQSKWWKRLGTREIRIPINCDPNYVGGYYIFARELGAKDAEFRNNNFWLDNKYHHWIDTVIKPREWLISRHLPGEGKLIKMDIHNLAESTLTFADSTEFDSTSSVRDTCTGCYWAKGHLRIEETPMDTGGCWNVTITNDSKCDYTILNLLIEQISDDFSRFEFDSTLNFKTITINSKQYFYKEIILDGDSSYSFRFCGDPATSYSYQYRIGTVITDTVVRNTGMSITNNIYACYSPLTGIITKGSCCDSITVQRGKWVQKATACQIDTTYKIFPIGAGLTRYDYGDCTVDYKINLNSNKCNIRSVNFKRVRLIDSNIENTEYNFLDKDTMTINLIVPCGNGDSGKYIYHLQFKDTTGSIKCDQIAIEKCICEYNEFERYYIDTSIIKNSQTWALRLAVIDSGSIQPPSEDPTSSDLMVYGILARDTTNPNNIYYCEQKQAGLEPPFDLSTPIVLDTITVPLDSSINVEVYFMDADSIVIGYARYDSTIYSNHVYISDLSVVPNPTNQILGIHYHVLEPVDVNVSVWDSFGNKMHDFGTSYHQIGDYDVSLDIGSYINGSYYVTTTARGDVQSVQFVIQRYSVKDKF